MPTTIKCPKCNIGMDIDIHKTPEPIFTPYFSSGVRQCPNCEMVIDMSITAYHDTDPFAIGENDASDEIHLP
jgi:hypothetical protein